MAAGSAAFREHVATLRQEVEEALDRWTQFDEDCPAKLREALRYSLFAPGKRLRPVLVLLAAEACGGDYHHALPAACAVEMVHTYSLIHDDLPAMDDDAMRRGQPSCHVRFDEATAILAGDALLAHAFYVLAAGITPPAVAAPCCQELAAAAGPAALVGGQVADMEPAADDEPGGRVARPQEAVTRLERIHRRKTGAMFRVSLRLGAMVSQTDEVRLAALDRYGQKLGLAFQIVDDLLDVGGDTAELGKTVGKDERQGKRTYPALLGLAESRRRAESLIAEAQTALTPLGTAAGHLQALAQYVLERKR